MTFNLFEESKLNGLGISLVVVFALLVCSYIYYSLVLPSQGGEYERERWNTKQKNKKSARERAAKAAAAQQQRKEENEMYRQKVRQQKPLTSQASAQDFINLSVDATDWFMDNFGHLWLKLRDLMENFQIELPNIDMSFLNFDFAKYYSLVKESDVGKLFCEILDMLVALGWLKKIEVTIRGVPLFCSNKIFNRVTFPQLMEKVLEFGQLCYTRLLSAIATGSLDAFFETEMKNAYDIEFTFLKSQKVLIDLGRGNEVDDVTFDRRLEECIMKTQSLLNSCAKNERAYYSSRLAILKDIQSARTLDQKDNIREKPYGILLFGGSGVGKSAIANSLIRYILKVNDRDYSPKAIITLNQEDKFQSEFRTHHKGVIMDDVCNASLDRTEGSPTTPIIMFLNQVPMSALNPNAEMKGQVMIEPDVVCVTTNVKDLLSNQLSNEPLSLNRRLDATITQKVRPEYRKDGTDMLDNSKIEHMASEQFPDYALFTVEEPRYADNTSGDKFKSGKTRSIIFTPMVFNGKPLVDIDIYELLEFLKSHSRDHFRRQKAFVAGQRALIDMPLCEHCRPIGHCAECTLESQAGVPNYCEVIEYLTSLEERACEWFTSVKRTLIMSKYGHFIMAYMMRDVLKGIVLNSVSNYMIAVVMLVFFELMHAAPCAITLIGVTFLYVLYIAIRFYFVRKTVVDSFTHTTRPSVYFREMTWATKKKWLAALASIGVWKILVQLAKKWKTLPTRQAAAPITLTPDAKEYQMEEEFWDRHARERTYQIGDAGVTKVARTTTPDQINNIVGKRLKIVLKANGVQCNGLPVMGNVVLLPNHFVPKETEFVTIKNVGGTMYQNLPLASNLCQRIPGTDLAVWYCPGIGNQKDLTMYYPLDILEGKKITAHTLYNDNGDLKIFPEMTAVRDRVITSEGGMFPGLKYTLSENTFGGLCMATLIGRAQGIPFIAGHHLAGRGTTGAAGVITRKQLMSAIETLDQKPGILVSHSAMPMETSVMGVEFGPLTRPHEKCETNNLTSTAKLRVHGAHTLPGASHTKSAVVTSLISGAVTSVMGIEKQHGPPKDMGAPRHKALDLSGKVDTATKFDAELAQKAYIDFATRLDSIPKEELARVGKISDDVNLAGLDGTVGVNAMNFSTSMGFPFKGPKTQYVGKSDRVVDGISCPRDADPLILEEVARLEKLLLEGKSINAVFKGSLKDEPTKLDKDKVRVFAACNMPTVMLVRKYFLTLAALCQRNKVITECAVGTVVQSPEWTELFEHIGKYGWDRAIAGDYAKFDGRMSPQFMSMAFKLLITIAEKSGNYDADDIKIMRGIATEITYPTYDYFGTLVQFFGSNPSGHPLTVIINSLVNSLYMRYAYYSIAKKQKWWRVPLFGDMCSFMSYGDDNIMTVKEGFDAFNHTAIAAELAAVDIKYTMAEKDAESVPFINLNEASFLKHFARFDSELGLYRSPVEESSIAKMLHTHLKSSVLSMEQSSAEAIQNVALKYFEFGREVYEEKVAQLRQVAAETGLTGYVGPIMNYDERLQWYREKFALESQSGYRHEKGECVVNAEEEQLQQQCVAEMPIKVTAKEYFFPGGASGDLMFQCANVIFVVEVKCCKNSGPKYRMVKKQAQKYADTFHTLYPKNCVIGLAYTYDGFSEIVKYGEIPEGNPCFDIKFPFEL